MKIAKLKDLFGIDARALGIFRIFIAIILILDLFVRCFAFTAHYTNKGTLPLDFYSRTYIDTGWISVHLFNGSAIYQATLFFLSFTFALFLLIGYRTKLSSILSWFLLISLHSRNPTILQGGDIMLRMLLFWAMFLPLNSRYSLDAKRRKINYSSFIFSFGTSGILLQVASVYFFSALLKTGVDWKDGQALYYALALDQFTTYAGNILFAFPEIMKFLTYFTYYLELIGPLLLFCPIFFNKIRLTIAFSFISLLVGMALCMNLGHFPFVGIAGLVLFLPKIFWDKLSTKIKFFIAKNNNLIIQKNKYSKILFNLVCLFFVVYIFLWNIQTIGKVNSVPDSIEFIAKGLRIDQYWNMFSPFPLKEDGWYIIEGTLADGNKIDLMTSKSIVYSKPRHVASLYKHERWRKYLMNLWDRGFSHHRPYYLHYLCYDWNKSHEINLDHVKMTFMLEKTLPNYEQSDIEPTILEEIDC